MSKENHLCWLIFLLSSFTFFNLEAQVDEVKEIEEIHAFVEKHINYSRDSSIALINFAAKKIKSLNDQNLAIKHQAENDLRRADYWTYYNLDSAEFYWKKAYPFYKGADNVKKLADTYTIKAQLKRLKNLGNHEKLLESIAYFDSAIALTDASTPPEFLSFIHYEKSISQQFADKWEESFENALGSVKFAELAEDSLCLATSYFLMGRTYHHFGLFNSSEEYISKAIEYGLGMRQLYAIIHIYADVLLQNEKIDLALEAYNQALQKALEVGDLQKTCVLYTNVGRIYLQKDQIKEAEAIFTILKETLDTNKIQAGYKTLLFLAEMNYVLGNKKEAIWTLNRFEYKYGKGMLIPKYVDAYKDAADLHSALNQPEMATLYYRRWGSLKDSLYSQTSKKQLNALEKMYLKERHKNQEIAIKNKELNVSRNHQSIMGGVLILVILLGGAIIYFVRIKGIKERQSLVVAFKEKQMEQMIEAQELERQRLARELHDGIGQSLAALRMQLQFDQDSNAKETAIGRLNIICKEVRSLSHQMMPIVLKENGLPSALRQLVDFNFSATNIEVDFVASNFPNRLPDYIEVNVYRITQELILNILKHSKATKAGIQLLRRGGKIVLIVEENGVGFRKQDKNTGIGLNNVRVRVDALGGELQISSQEQEGAYIHITIPVLNSENKRIA